MSVTSHGSMAGLDEVRLKSVDQVGRIVQVALLVLVSPALVLVLVVGGAFVLAAYAMKLLVLAERAIHRRLFPLTPDEQFVTAAGREFIDG